MWKFSFKFILLGALTLFLSGCGVKELIDGSFGGPTGRMVLSSREVPKEPYYLQAGDKLDIYVWAKEELAHRVFVREDGFIHFPPVGKIPALGYSLQELEKVIQDEWNALVLSKEASQEPSDQEPIPDFSNRKTVTLQSAKSHSYKLREGDKLQVSVYGHDDLNKTLRLREDGAFIFPLIGIVKATGRTTLQIEEDIQQRLDRDFLIDPQASVQLMEAEFSILWEGSDSGSFSIGSGMDLLTAISQVGDITASGSNRVEIIREVGGTEVVIQAHMGRVIAGKAPNIPILPRDTIYVKLPPQLVEERQVTIQLVSATFTALGDVGRPGPLGIDGPVDLLTALSLAGGITKFGSSKIEVMRKVGDTQLVIHANVDRILQGRDPNFNIHPRDTLYVRRRLF